MDLEFAKQDLRRLAEDSGFRSSHDASLVTKYRMRIQLIRDARDERDFYAMKSLHYEKLKGKRSHQRSMRLNAQWRLILEIEATPSASTVRVIDIEDYH